MSGIRLSSRDLGLEDLILRAKYHKERAEAAAQDYEEAQERLIKALEQRGHESAMTDRITLANTHPGRVRVKVVRRHQTKINEIGLKKALGAPLWRKVSKTLLDKAKLEDAISSGVVDATVVAQHAVTVAVKPYLAISVVEGDADDEG